MLGKRDLAQITGLTKVVKLEFVKCKALHVESNRYLEEKLFQVSAVQAKTACAFPGNFFQKCFAASHAVLRSHTVSKRTSLVSMCVIVSVISAAAMLLPPLRWLVKAS